MKKYLLMGIIVSAYGISVPIVLNQQNIVFTLR
ncbi:DUF2574 family protein [Salmonella enterica subsp. enterica serovar Typhimurium]|nr:DUF2574 family protein [Salmonella enterica subsp. enterica serovar Typhimurium]